MSILAIRVARTEDRRLLSAGGTLSMPCGFRGRAGLRRSFAQITGVDVPALRDKLGVIAGFTGDDRGDLPSPATIGGRQLLAANRGCCSWGSAWR